MQSKFEQLSVTFTGCAVVAPCVPMVQLINFMLPTFVRGMEISHTHFAFCLMAASRQSKCQIANDKHAEGGVGVWGEGWLACLTCLAGRTVISSVN